MKKFLLALLLFPLGCFALPGNGPYPSGGGGGSGSTAAPVIFTIPNYYQLWITNYNSNPLLGMTDTVAAVNPYTWDGNGFNDLFVPHEPCWTNVNGRMIAYMQNTTNYEGLIAGSGFILTVTNFDVFGGNTYYDNLGNYISHIPPGWIITNFDALGYQQWVSGLFAPPGTGTNGGWPSGDVNGGLGPCITYGTNIITNTAAYFTSNPSNSLITVDAVGGNDSTASVGGLPFKTILAAAHFAPDPSIWDFKAGVYTNVEFEWTPRDATIKFEPGAWLRNEDVNVGGQFAPIGIGQCVGVNFLQPIYGFSGPNTYYLPITTNEDYEDCTWVSEHGSLQGGTGTATLTNATLIIRNCNITSGSWGLEFTSETNMQVIVANNIIQENSWLIHSGGSAPSSVQNLQAVSMGAVNGVLRLIGNTFIYSNNFADSGGASILQVSSSSTAYVNGNIVDQTLGTNQQNLRSIGLITSPASGLVYWGNNVIPYSCTNLDAMNTVPIGLPFIGNTIQPTVTILANENNVIVSSYITNFVSYKSFGLVINTGSGTGLVLTNYVQVNLPVILPHPSIFTLSPANGETAIATSQVFVSGTTTTTNLVVESGQTVASTSKMYILNIAISD